MIEYYDCLCACGCGQKILIRPSHKYSGVPKFLLGHGKRGWRKKKDPLPEYYDHLCACGCGGRIPVRECHRWGGIPQYLNGHWLRTLEGHKAHAVGARARRGRPSSQKGKTLEEIFGVEKAADIKRRTSETETGKVVSLETRVKLRESHIGLMVGEKNPNWNGGTSFLLYPQDFNINLKEKVRKRDGYRCWICKLFIGDMQGRMCIHHIDYDKKNLDLNNLILLCRSCHSATNHNREYWKQQFQLRRSFYGHVH